jgi:hypothetical protein
MKRDTHNLAFACEVASRQANNAQLRDDLLLAADFIRSQPPRSIPNARKPKYEKPKIQMEKKRCGISLISKPLPITRSERKAYFQNL